MLIRVQLDPHSTEEMCDQETLMKWAREGKLQSTHKIWDDREKVWKLAKDHPLLSGLFAQSLWDAWEEEDGWELDPDIETGIRKRQQQSQTSLMQPEEEVQQKVVPTLPSSAIVPLDEAHIKKEAPARKESALPKRVEQRKVNPSPVKQRTSREPQNRRNSHKNTGQAKRNSPPSEITLNRAKLWQPEIPLQDQPQLWVQEEKKESSFSMMRLAILVIPVLFLFLVVRWYIVSEASAVFPLEEELDETSAELLVGNTNSDAMFLELENRLKNQIRSTTSIVSRTMSLEDALRIDMEYAKLDIQWIQAEVTSWTGRKLDIPNAAEIQISINSNGVLDEELALVSLIVARYTERYFPTMDTFTVVLNIEGNAFQKEIKVLDARKLLLHPGSLQEFLTAVMQ